jgi:hypothetical protein
MFPTTSATAVEAPFGTVSRIFKLRTAIPFAAGAADLDIERLPGYHADFTSDASRTPAFDSGEAPSVGMRTIVGPLGTLERNAQGVDMRGDNIGLLATRKAKAFRDRFGVRRRRTDQHHAKHSDRERQDAPRSGPTFSTEYEPHPASLRNCALGVGASRRPPEALLDV